jgi:hypothetical protein
VYTQVTMILKWFEYSCTGHIHNTFFLPYEFTPKARVFVLGRPFQLSVM